MNSQGNLKNQVQDILSKTEKHLHRMFIAGTVFGAICCFARADYNLPMFAFLYVMFDQDDVSLLPFAEFKLIGDRIERQTQTHVFDGAQLPW